MFCRSLMVGGFDRDDVRSGFGLSIDVDDFVDRWWCGEFDRDDVRSGFGLSIDIDVLSMLMVMGFERDDDRSGVGLSISLDRLKLENRSKLYPCVR
jgi:hypothetical protein